MNKKKLPAAFEAHILGTAQLMGYYTKKGLV